MANISNTESSFKEVMANCRKLFADKTHDYGTSWRILRLPSITDQLFIKANRIRSIQEKGVQKVADNVLGEFIGIANYSIIALIQLKLMEDERTELPKTEVIGLYDQEVQNCLALMQAKNHDYGEAWRLMRISSITDIILMKLLRVKQIESNEGKSRVSEGVDANYRDMLNYAVFAMILMQEEKGTTNPPS